MGRRWLCLKIIVMALGQHNSSRTLVTRLSHHHSLNSPYYNPNISKRDLADFDLKSSIYRALYLVGNVSSLLHVTDLKSELIPRQNGGFLANIYVGSSNVSQLVYMDTASSLLWINCEPCSLNVPAPIFHPKESSSFVVDNCDDSDICDITGAVKVWCNFDEDDDDGCKFIIRYANGASCDGEVAREQFIFGSSTPVQQNIFFGCAFHNNGLFVNGVLGLGNDPISFRAQRGYSKFAYCIGDVSDRSYRDNILIIADTIALRGDRTPLIVENKYYINLEGIKIGDFKLDFDPQIFKRNSFDYTGGMLVDSGSTYTFMPKVVVEKFEARVIDVIANGSNDLTRNTSITYGGVYSRLCYNGDVKRDFGSFPVVQFEFQGGATMGLTGENIFHQVSEGSLCLGILPIEVVDEGATVSILGNLVQQYFYLAFDLDIEKFAFERMDCNILADGIL